MVDKNQGYGIFLIRVYYVHFIAIKINELSFLCLGLKQIFIITKEKLHSWGCIVFLKRYQLNTDTI